MDNNYLSQITMDSQPMDTDNNEQYSQESIQESERLRPMEATDKDITGKLTTCLKTQKLRIKLRI